MSHKSMWLGPPNRKMKTHRFAGATDCFATSLAQRVRSRDSLKPSQLNPPNLSHSRRPMPRCGCEMDCVSCPDSDIAGPSEDRTSNVLNRFDKRKSELADSNPVAASIASEIPSSRTAALSIQKQVVLVDQPMSSFGQDLQGHIDVIDGNRNRSVTFAAIDQRVGVMNVDLGLQQ